jgi:predicted DNA-binding transcriptional regulator AlpA
MMEQEQELRPGKRAAARRARLARKAALVTPATAEPPPETPPKVKRQYQAEDPPGVERLIRPTQIRAYTGWGHTQLDDKIKKGEFPPPISLSDSGRAVAWLASEVARWQRSRVAKRDAAGAAAVAGAAWVAGDDADAQT